jgi:hypothetical protein
MTSNPLDPGPDPLPARCGGGGWGGFVDMREFVYVSAGRFHIWFLFITHVSLCFFCSYFCYFCWPALALFRQVFQLDCLCFSGCKLTHSVWTWSSNKAQAQIFFLFRLVSAEEMCSRSSSSLLVGQHAQEIYTSTLLVFLEIKNKLYAAALTVPRINAYS